MHRRDPVDDVLDTLSRSLRAYADRGLGGYACSEAAKALVEGWSAPLQGAGETLEEIRLGLGDCRRCGLHRMRRHIVFGCGDPGADLVFVGEGPGRDEDLQGEPFVGAAGELLTRIIQAIRLTRDQVYICNVVKCRPPKNRDPESEEIDTCLPFLRRQLAALRPKFVVTLGAVAARALLGTDRPISRLRGRFHELDGMRILPTYHPAYLLRNPEKKRDVWEDMQKLMRVYPYDG